MKFRKITASTWTDKSAALLYQPVMQSIMPNNKMEIVGLFRESVELKPAEASFRQGWKEAIVNNIEPVSELRDGIDAE